MGMRISNPPPFRRSRHCLVRVVLAAFIPSQLLLVLLALTALVGLCGSNNIVTAFSSVAASNTGGYLYSDLHQQCPQCTTTPTRSRTGTRGNILTGILGPRNTRAKTRTRTKTGRTRRTSLCLVSTTTTPSSSSSSSSSASSDVNVNANVPVSAVSALSVNAKAKEREDDGDVNIEVDVDVDDITFPPPLSGVDQLKRAAKFWSTAIPIVSNYYLLITQVKLQELLLNKGEALPEEQLERMWDEQHADGAAKLAETFANLKGFYVKTAQIISARQDLFPPQYTEALSGFTDNLDPMPAALAKAVIESELLTADETFADVFAEFDEIPLGAASVAQVHRAVLTPKYGGPRVVAVKVQRPSIESKLLGDVANLKALAKTFRDSPSLPLDYYTVFAELEKQLADEFDFVAEAVAMDRIYNALRRAPNGSLREMPLVMPRPVPGLISKRVLVMDYLEGVPLSRAREEMIKKGIDPESPEAKLFGKQLLNALTDCFGRSVLETGFFHADPHPGNIFVLEDGRIGLIDFGQVKQISGRNRETLCKTMIALDERKRSYGDDEDDLTPEDMQLAGKMAIELGVEIKDTAQDEAAAAVALWLFDGSVKKLPGGYDMGELSPNSPVKELKSFPQDLVLVGRSTILIKGISSRLGIPHSLASQWAPIARQVLANNYNPQHGASMNHEGTSIRFRDVLRTFRQWGKGRANGFVRRLPSPIRNRIAAFVVRRQERQSRASLLRRKKH